VHDLDRELRSTLQPTCTVTVGLHCLDEEWPAGIVSWSCHFRGSPSIRVRSRRQRGPGKKTGEPGWLGPSQSPCASKRRSPRAFPAQTAEYCMVVAEAGHFGGVRERTFEAGLRPACLRMTVVVMDLQRSVVGCNRSAGSRIRIGRNAFSNTLAMEVDRAVGLLRPESTDMNARAAATALKAAAPTDKPHGQRTGSASRRDWHG
jgi:hypothetical protein